MALDGAMVGTMRQLNGIDFAEIVPYPMPGATNVRYPTGKMEAIHQIPTVSAHHER
jgi:hypothetical protein